MDRLLRISARVLRAINNMRRESIPRELDLQPEELEETRIFWINFTQNKHFGSIINRLNNGQDTNSNHPMARLIPYVDEDQTLRLGGRLNRSDLQPEAKNPAMLPKQSRFTSLVIEEAHLKSHILKCVTCARHRAIRAQQLMDQLPPSRITPVRAFLHTGVDYAGPLKINRWRGPGAKQYQGYIAVFGCLATSTIHLELITDLTL
ncbi:uncharacterized protein LOC107047935 [Diachasma alloeum]|uniref:uncharacterized protein LOC107047935 n=1 Tax=Diachasma alloeum TaxID=454923 RepID=UPI0007382712|nr:uncharacterized protein LOC107047935 [Diachasma alloeum]